MLPTTALKKEDRERIAEVATVLAHLTDRAKRALNATANIVVRHYAASDESPESVIYSAAGDMRQHLAATLGDVYRSARAEALDTVQRDLGAVKAMGARAGNDAIDFLAVPTDSVRTDHEAARRFAETFSAGLLRAALEQYAQGTAMGVDVANAAILKGALERRRAHLETIAITEASKTFSDERRQSTLKAISKSVYLHFTYRRWNAILDDRTCEECANLDGQVVPYGQSFESGFEPGSVHARCRCFDDLVAGDSFRSPID